MDIKINCDSKKAEWIIKSLSYWYANFKPLLKDFSTIQLASADESFKTRWKNIWMPWQRLKIATTKQKIRIWKNIDILQRTGKMRKAFKVSKLTSHELEIENTMSYFKYHQLWTKKIHQRQVLWHSPVLIKRYEIAYIDYILNLIQKWTK